MLAPLKDIMMTKMMIPFSKFHWDEKTDLHFDFQTELQMELNLGLMKELSQVIQLYPLMDTVIERLMVNL